MFTWRPDFVGQLLQTGIERFDTPIGIHGLGKQYDSTLELLAVSADHPGKGEFRNFMAYCKSVFATIYVWEIWNDDLRNALVRYGFTDCQRTESDGEQLTGMRWTKPEIAPVLHR